MAKNKIQEGRYLPLTLAAKVSGDPCVVGQIFGVATIDTQADGTLVLDTQGVYDLPVKAIDGGGNSAVAIGDIIYHTEADTPKLSKKSTGVRFGKALETITSGATDTILVRLGY